MRYLTLRVAGSEAELHPLVPSLTDPDVFREAQMVDWAPSLDPPRATVLLYVDGDIDRFVEVLAATDLVLEHDVTRFAENRGYVYVHSEPHPIEWRLFEVGTMEGLIPVFPIQYHHDGTITARIVGPTATLQAAVESVPPGIDATLERVGEYDLGRPPIPPSLPPRQDEALRTALELGYYEVPREAGRDEVAAAMDCAPSTASEHLQKAEREVVSTYLNRDH
ncbi:helix-turn-helix domain-containing protein [Haloarchaeobius iranensis]|uniref:HTH DNA binding domain-containing protein n=1 Tax=Haloarchaeobius iranensis TaxID=996166 RepID=A0A1G9YK96_9EURY|nr:helix-turn-helix domain-containing protein [Haloarchaeobius iranensis]SDN09588.1 HTH DNA binding domain-containing protein [Haloarchaeobius iranensis]